MTMKEGKGYRKSFWTVEEDRTLMDYMRKHGKGRWNRVATMTGLKRCGKSCRLRWINYLSPSVNRDNFTEEEDDLIIRLHKLLGNRWSLIAGRVPGRTDNQVKNHWNTHLSKKLGTKKETTKVKTCAKTHTIEAEENFSFTPEPESETCSKEKAGDTNRGGLEDGSGGSLETKNNDFWESSFLFPSDDINQNAEDLVRVLDWYSFDFAWNDF